MHAVSFRRRALAGAVALAVTSWTIAAQAQCLEPSFEAFEAARYTVRRVEVTGLMIGGGALADLAARAAEVKAGAPFTAAGIARGQAAIREALRDAPSLVETPVHVTIVTRTVSACDPQRRELDVVYRVLSTKLRVTGAATGEPRRGGFDQPADEREAASRTARFALTPLVRYNAAEHLVGGARASWVLPGLFDAFEADVQASSSAAYADITLSGERVTESGWLRAANWRLAYGHADRPAEREILKTRALAVQFAALTRPLGSHDAVIKVASVIEGGRQWSTRETGGLGAAGGSQRGFGRWKNAINLNLQLPRQALEASYGVQLGFTAAGGSVDYVKHIVDLAYDARVVRAQGSWGHRPFTLAARLGAGALRGEDIPAAERFVGGSVDVPFLSTPGWTVRGTPVLRSYPAYRLNASDPSARGGDGFVAINLTAGLPLWFRPLVPAEVAADEEIRELVEGQLASAESALEVVHKSADPAHRAIAARMPELAATLQAMQGRLDAMAPALPNTARPRASDCQDQIETLLATIEASRSLGFLAGESEDDVSLPSVRRVCVQGLGAQLKDAELETRGRDIEAMLAFVRRQLDRIDTASARQRARQDLKLPRRTVRAVFDELNAVSIGPLLMLDAARVWNRMQSGEVPTRAGLGTGVRISVVNALHVSAGYLWNLSHSAAGRRGAGFAILEFTRLVDR